MVYNFKLTFSIEADNLEDALDLYSKFVDTNNLTNEEDARLGNFELTHD